MVKTVSSVNQKGGPGKSTTIHNLTVGLTLRGYKVLLIDTDENETTTTWFNERQKRIAEGEDLVNFDCQIVEASKVKSFISERDRLYHFILIDTEPSQKSGIASVILASNLSLVPTEANGLGTKEEDTQRTVELVRQVMDAIPSYKAKFVINKADKRTKGYEELTEKFESQGLPCFSSKLSYYQVHKDSAEVGKCVMDYPKTQAFLQVSALVDEVLEELNNGS